jgi:outer membrane lipopolysaccharide assembly protein LptE/RlpB
MLQSKMKVRPKLKIKLLKIKKRKNPRKKKLKHKLLNNKLRLKFQILQPVNDLSS